MAYFWGIDGQAVTDRPQSATVTLPSLKSLFAVDLQGCKRSSLSSPRSPRASLSKTSQSEGISSKASARTDQRRYRNDSIHDAPFVPPNTSGINNPDKRFMLPAPNSSQALSSAPPELPHMLPEWALGSTLPPLRDHLPPPLPPAHHPQQQPQQGHHQYGRCDSISSITSLPQSYGILPSMHNQSPNTGPLPSMNSTARDNRGNIRSIRSRRPISVELPPIRSHRNYQSLRPCSLTADYTSRPLSPGSPYGPRHDFWHTGRTPQPNHRRWKSISSSRRCSTPYAEQKEDSRKGSMGTVIMSPSSSDVSVISQPRQERTSSNSPPALSLQPSPESKTAASRRGKKRRGNLPKHVTDVLRSWFLEHLNHPYPTEKDKHMFILQTGLTVNQISNWFINVRRRQLPAIRSQQARSIITATSGSQSVPASTATSTAATPDLGTAYYDTFEEFSRDRRKSSNSTMISQ